MFIISCSETFLTYHFFTRKGQSLFNFLTIQTTLTGAALNGLFTESQPGVYIESGCGWHQKHGAHLMQIIQIDQRTQQWHKVRKGIPTASAANKIVTGTGRRSAQARYYMGGLLNERQGFELQQFGQTDAMARGIALEPEARTAFERHMGVETEEVGFVLRRDQQIGCSPDGLIRDSGGKLCAGLEIKCPLPHNHNDICWSKILPNKYKPQVHASMAITGLRTWWFMSYCPDVRPLIIKETWNDYTDFVKNELDNFIRRLDAASIRKGIDNDWRDCI